MRRDIAVTKNKMLRDIFLNTTAKSNKREWENILWDIHKVKGNGEKQALAILSRLK
jgi:hypothetical protein